MDYNKIIDVLEGIQKDITTANTMGQAGNTGLSRQDLESGITKLSNRNVPFRDRLRRKKGNGLAHAWNQRTNVNGVNPINVVYAENALGSTLTPGYKQVSAAYVSLGLVTAVSNLALAAGASFTDLEAEEVEATMRSVIQAEEWLNFHGDATQTNGNGVSPYNGLDKQITTNVIALNGNITTDAIDDAFQRIAANGGGPGNYVIYVSMGVLRKINQILQASGAIVRVVTEDAQKVPFGLQATYYPSIFGPVPLVWDYFVNPQGNFPYPYNNTGSSSSTTGNTTSSVYIVNHDYIAMVDLKTLGKEPLYMTSADNTRSLINEYTVMEVTAEPFMAIITGVTEPTY